jgi:KDO2-lipid IV(A) lauroyltransferase
MENLGMALIESGHPQYLRPESLRRFVAVQGREHLDEALQQGRGAILVTAHFGNFPLFMMKLGLEGYPIGVIVRNPRYRLMARFLDDYRARFGIHSLRDKPRRVSVKESLAFLRDNGVLVLHVDVNVSHGGMFVPFFGHWVPAFRGPAQLSLHTKAPALPTFIRRVNGLHHRMTIHPPLPTPSTGDREEDIWRLLWGLTRKTEDTIRKHPEQYFWLHRRFRKERPYEEVGRPVPDTQF